MNGEKETLKTKLAHELKLFWSYTLFFAFFFSLFGTYKRLILSEYAISYVHYGYSFFEAAILSKVILIGQAIKLGDRFKTKPLIYPVVYKTVIFSIFVFLFDILEHFVDGYFKGINNKELYQELTVKSLDQMFAGIVVMSFVFFLFFAFFELARVIGEKKLFTLFFKKRIS